MSKFLTKEEQLGRCFAIKIHGGPFQRSGLPDWIIFRRNRVLLVETKAPGEKQRPLQRQVAAVLGALEHVVWVPTTFAEFLSIYHEEDAR
jgi:hypothetical protein